MARLRKFVAYRALERPFTRKSKYNEKSYLKSVPSIVIARFNMGNPRREYPYRVYLRVKCALQIRHNALESARQTANRMMEKAIGNTMYAMTLLVYPHHALRENKLAAGAGADRMSMGMSLSYGTVISLAAQLRVNQAVLRIDCDKVHLELAKKALHRASTKLPCTCIVTVEEYKKKE